MLRILARRQHPQSGAIARICTLVLLVTCLFQTGCDSDSDQAGRDIPPTSKVLAESMSQVEHVDGEPDAGDAIKASRPWRITYLMKNYDWADPYWQRTSEGAVAAGKDFEVDVWVRGLGGRNTIEFQIQMMNALIRADLADGIVIAPIDTNRLSPVTEKAIQAGIPVIVHDTPLNAEGTLTYIGFDNFKAGKLLGRWVVEQLSGRGDVLILEGISGNQNAIERRNGMMAGLREGDINVLGLRSGGWQRHEARHITAAWLDRFHHIDAILAANDAMALGVAEAVEAAGREGILITGFDANPDALLAIRQGRLHATIDQVPERLARQAVQLMVRHLETGETFPPIMLWGDIRLITGENVSQFLE